MKQQTGETRDAIIEDDEKLVQQILDANKSLTEIYYIVIFAKPSKNSIDGKPTLVKHIKPYKTKPKEMVGQIVGEVNNATGELKWTVNMPQRPFDFNGLLINGAQECDEHVIETCTIPGAYITQ